MQRLDGLCLLFRRLQIVGGTLQFLFHFDSNLLKYFFFFLLQATQFLCGRFQLFLLLPCNLPSICFFLFKIWRILSEEGSFIGPRISLISERFVRWGTYCADGLFDVQQHPWNSPHKAAWLETECRTLQLAIPGALQIQELGRRILLQILSIHNKDSSPSMSSSKIHSGISCLSWRDLPFRVRWSHLRNDKHFCTSRLHWHKSVDFCNNCGECVVSGQSREITPLKPV